MFKRRLVAFVVIFSLSSWYVNTTTNKIKPDFFLSINNLLYDVEHFTQKLVNHISLMLCEFRSNLIYIYFEDDLKTTIAETLIYLTNKCSSVCIVRYTKNSNITLVNDDGVKTYHVNILANRNNNDINLSYIKSNSGDKHNSHFIILYENDMILDDLTWMIEIFNKFWHLNLLNVLIIFWSGDELKVYTYSPFENKFLVELPKDVLKIPSKIFWDKTQNLNKNPFKVSLFAEKTRAVFKNDGKLLGSDGYLTEVVINQMNATLRLLPPTDGYDIGEFLSNGSSTGSLAQIIKREVDISFNTRFLRLAQFQGKVEITFTNGRDDICILVAKAGFASNVNNIFRAFSKSVWIMVIASIFVVSASFAGIYRIQNTGIRNIHNILFNFYSYNLAQSIVKLPEQWTTKIIIGFWIIYCLLITSSYQGNLTSNLVLRPTLPEIDTIKQLEQSSIKILTFGRYVDLLQNFLNQTGSYNKLKPRIRGVSATDLNDYIKNNDVRYAYANKYHINQYISKSKSHIFKGRPVFHNMNECPVPYLVAYAVFYGSPYLQRVNTIIRRAQEAGLILYWDKQTEETSSNNGGIQRSDNEPVSLTLDHVQSAFYILNIGLCIAWITLFLEIFYMKYCSKKN